MRIAVYARYSTNNQNERSIEDQFSSCKHFINRTVGEDHELVFFSDHALSGLENIKRIGFSKLLQFIEQDQVDMVVSEGLDRLSRQLSIIARFYETAQFHSVKISTIQEGDISQLSIGFKGTMNELYISSNRIQTIRAQKELARSGKVFGRSYGYKIKIKNGREVTGERAIDRKQAKIIKRIFKEFAAGHTVVRIVNDLNQDKIPSPRGKKWGKTSILGAFSRNEGILNKEIYRGIACWGKRSVRTNPITQEKAFFTNPKEEWIKTSIPELRIISDKLWFDCQKQIAERHFSRPAIKKTKRRKGLINPLNGVIFCNCGSKKTLANAGRYVCSSARSYGTCKNLRGMREDEIFSKAMDGLLEQLYAYSPQEYNEVLLSTFKPEIRDKKLILKDLKNCEKAITNLLQAIASADEQTVNELSALLKNKVALKKVLNNKIKFLVSEVPSNAHHLTARELLKIKEQEKSKENIEITYAKLVTLVDRFIASPIEGKRFGENLQIILNETAWTDFYRKYVNPTIISN